MNCDDPMSLSDDDNVIEIISENSTNHINRNQFSVIDTIVLDDESQRNFSENNNDVMMTDGDENSKLANELFPAISKENKLLGILDKEAQRIIKNKLLGTLININKESQCIISENNNAIIINDDENSNLANNLCPAISKENKLLGAFINKESQRNISENNNAIIINDDENSNLANNLCPAISKENELLGAFINKESQRIVSENNNAIMIIDDDENSKLTNNLYRAISKENKLLGEFINNCLQLENSKGMDRVINNTLIKSYMETNKSYRNSEEGMKVIRNALNCLKTAPGYKFSHVKNLSDTFKSKSFKKRVKLTTLATNLKENRPQSNEFTRSKTIVIDSDEEQNIPVTENGVTIINLDDDLNDVIVLDGPDVPMETDNEKENKDEGNNYLIPHVEVSWERNASLVSTAVTEDKVPDDDPNLKLKRVKKIERQIEYCKKRIEILEEAEVNDDSLNSPYIKCEMMKTKIVSLYSELCQITGHEAVKRHEVRLQVIEGHAEGSVRNLEKFINYNIGSDGEPHIPDFYDVVNCVSLSNLEDNLGWSKHQIMKEACALFTQCGRALQRRRQKREWRHLMQRVKTEADADPADEDPLLLARLDANKKIAMKKENDLLARFSMMQDLPKQPSLVVRNNIAESSNSKTVQHAETETITEENKNNENHVEKEFNFLEARESKDSQESNKTGMKEHGCLEEIKEPTVLETSSVIINEIDTAPDVDVKVKVEEEPIDVISQLEKLGDNYTITITDIEDPFLVIEVSSDSSCDEAEKNGYEK